MRLVFIRLAVLFFMLLGCSTRSEYFDSPKDRICGYDIRIVPQSNEIDTLLQEVKRYTPDLRKEISGCNYKISIYLNIGSKCKECFFYDFRSFEESFEIDLSGDYPLGIQYGIYKILEDIGYRFLSPYKEYVPESINLSEFIKSLKDGSGYIHTPFMGIRGLHLHTLHPIEGFYDIWLGSDTDNAFRIIDWLVKIRGNFIQWVALRDINNVERYNEWKNKTQSIIEYAHKRGIRVGINCLVFAASSLQNGYVIDEKKDLNFLKELSFEAVNLSFGEFVGNEPERFISEVKRITDDIYNIKPSIDVTGTIHVGNYDNLWVNYNNETILYYFLVKYIEGVIPFVHTVMYFNLLEPAVGAYNHKTFKEHREFLVNYLRKEKRVIYFPESAYWIAFDNSVPLYLPIYLRSRYMDIELIYSECKSEMCRKNTGHIIFSSGWEWGYHQTDYLSTRLSYRFGNNLREEVVKIFSPMGENGSLIGELVYELSEIQKSFLIDKKLAPYYVGVDAWVELGHKSGIIGQPDRVMIDEVKSLNDERKEFFRKNILMNLELFLKSMDEFNKKVLNIEYNRNDFIDEVIDGFKVDYYRSIFVYNVYAAVFYNDLKYLNKAEKAMTMAEQIVKNRHKRLFYPRQDVILLKNENPTIYKFGYLKQADNLCLYKRDYIKAKNIIKDEKEVIPTCVD